MSTSTKTILTAAHWGPMLVETDGENVLSSRGALPTQHPNSLQTVVRDQVHSKTRVRWPMVRKGFLASPDKPQGIRGQDEFVRVSWDDALALIHTQHKRIRDSYGPSSIFAGSYGWRSNGVLHKASTLLQRYMSLAGGYTGHLGLLHRCGAGDHAVCRGRERGVPAADQLAAGAGTYRRGGAVER